jgi:DNA-directed RNA polymerase subunit RPC12/RpoP
MAAVTSLRPWQSKWPLFLTFAALLWLFTPSTSAGQRYEMVPVCSNCNKTLPDSYKSKYGGTQCPYCGARFIGQEKPPWPSSEKQARELDAQRTRLNAVASQEVPWTTVVIVLAGLAIAVVVGFRVVSYFYDNASGKNWRHEHA